MEYRKENHFIVAYKEGKLRGKWDILTNQYIGIKGGVLKSKSPAFTNGAEIRTMDEVLRAAYTFSQFSDRWNPYTPQYGQKLEEIVSVGLIIDHDWALWREFLRDTTKLNKDYVQFIKDNYNGIYSRRSISNYTIYKHYRVLLEKCGDKKNWASEVIGNISDATVPRDFIAGMILRGIHEKVFFNKRPYDYAHLITAWYQKVTAMGDKLEVKHNILTNYTILSWLYDEYKHAHYNENLKKYNDLKWLYFEDDKYIVFPLLTRNDFHTEATVQQNCVERMYMDSVADGNTHVVAVRLKSNRDHPYITCEVDNNHHIIQYLLRFNNRPHTEADINFKAKYATHLISSLDK